MARTVVTNRTSLTDLEHFLKLVCFLYEYWIRALTIQIPDDFERVSSIADEIMIEVALELEIETSEVTGFITSAFELYNSLVARENLYESSLGKFYYENFKPIDYDFIGQTKMKAFRINKRKLLSVQGSKTKIVQVADALQYVLANMEIVNSLSHKLNTDVAEHNCIVRNEIDFKIAYIELFIVFAQTAVPCNLYWIEGDSMDPDEAILKETIGHTSNLFETTATQDKSIVIKIAA